MRTTQIWILLAVLLGAIVGSLWIAFDFYKLSEQRAWLACIKEYDPASAQNLVCRSQFPRPFKQWGSNTKEKRMQPKEADVCRDKADRHPQSTCGRASRCLL